VTTLPEIARRIVEAYTNALDSADEGLRTHTNPGWLDRLDASASHVMGVIFVWVRVMSSIAALMWSFFLCVLPLLLATWLIVSIVAIASTRAASR
jgi:hypothetical protein